MPLTPGELADAVLLEAEQLADRKGFTGILDREAFINGCLVTELTSAFIHSPKYAERRTKELKPQPSSK